MRIVQEKHRLACLCKYVCSFSLIVVCLFVCLFVCYYLLSFLCLDVVLVLGLNEGVFGVVVFFGGGTEKKYFVGI